MATLAAKHVSDKKVTVLASLLRNARSTSSFMDYLLFFLSVYLTKPSFRHSASFCGNSHSYESHKPNAFVDVQLMPGGTQMVYVITIEASLLPPVRALLEDRLGRRCDYVQGSFLVYGNEVDRLLSQ